MKIEDFIRETLVKTDLAAKGKVDAEPAVSKDTATGVINVSPDADFVFPDLLQAFGKLLGRRQLLMEELPGSVKARLPETTLVSAGGNGGMTETAAAGKATFEQGLSGLVRDNRTMTEALRQVVNELEFIDRAPGMAKVFATVDKNSIINSLVQRSTESLPTSPAQSGIQPDRASLMSESSSVVNLVDGAINKLQVVMANFKPALTPSDHFQKLMLQSLQQGKLDQDFSDWIADISALIEKSVDDPKMSGLLAKWQAQAEPGVVQLAQTTGRPEITKVWAVVQEWGGLQPISNSSALLGTKIASVLEGLNFLVPQAVDPKQGLQFLQPVNSINLPSYTMRVELLYSGLISRPEALEKSISLLPELLNAAEPILGTLRAKGPTESSIYDTLARSAPKWLKSMAEREAKPALIELWVAAKMADASPWMKMEQAERQQLSGVLKELMTSFEPPEPFRMPHDDSASRSFMLQIPLYGPGQEKPYPALIQVFEEKKERGSQEPPEQEIWVRVSLVTDNIGTVDLSFRLQDKKYLSIFSRFADPEAASEFRSSLAEIRQEFAGGSLELQKISVAGRINTGGRGADG